VMVHRRFLPAYRGWTIADRNQRYLA